MSFAALWKNWKNLKKFEKIASFKIHTKLPNSDTNFEYSNEDLIKSFTPVAQEGIFYFSSLLHKIVMNKQRIVAMCIVVVIYIYMYVIYKIDYIYIYIYTYIYNRL